MAPQDRKSAWKRKMLDYHPDKQAQSQSPTQAEAVSEVFREIKRRYDFVASQEHSIE